MITVICLGNKGDRYVETRHNVAWIIADRINSSDGWSFNKYANAELLEDADVLWVKPQTFMNNSGEVLSFLRKQYDVDEQSLVVIYDDLDLPAGKVKISHNRGDGGHNGVKSVVKHFGSQAFTRIRVGVAPVGGRDKIMGDFREYVLCNLDQNQETAVLGIVGLVEKMIKTIAKEGYDSAMNKWN